MLKKGCLFICCFAFIFCSYAQNFTEQQLRATFDSLSVKSKGLNNRLQLNVSGISTHELITSVSMENNLNFIIDPGLNQLVSYNFYDALVKDMLVFLYLNYEIEYDFVGTIIYAKKRKKPEIVQVIQAKQLDIKYNPSNNFLSVDLKNDTLYSVFNEITRQTGLNFVLHPDLRDRKINSFVLNRPLEQVIDMIAQSNAFAVSKDEKGNFQVNFPPKEDLNINGNNQNKKNSTGTRLTPNSNPSILVTKANDNKVNIQAYNSDLMDLIRIVSDETSSHYVLYSEINGKVTLDVTDVTFGELLTRVFNGSKYGFKSDNGLFVIGEHKMEGLRTTELIRLENRTIENVKTAIPKELISDLEISEFVELNALIATGNQRSVYELKRFISSIDVVVPMVQIDVMLIVSRVGSTVQTGIKAGLKEAPTNTSGTIFPEVDVELGATTLNQILSSISGFGFLNLGQVTENFYVSLQALESNNVIDIESTPRISTLNGHQAKISIGETTYYQETQVNVQTTINNQGVLQSKIWKSIDANLSVVIKPFVSADEHVTLSITVDQNDFSGKVDPTAPPNATTQKFESLVRVKNGEIILLGGLEEKTKTQSGSGVPFLSRIPVIRWFFGNRSKTREKSKLHILIRPTVTY